MVKRVRQGFDLMELGKEYVMASDYVAIEADRDNLLEALELADAVLSGANMDMKVVERKVKAAIAKARSDK